MTLRVIALGQPAAGDDGAGPAVIEALRRGGVPEGVELHAAGDPSALVGLVCTPARVVIVDAVLAPPAGRLLDLELDALENVAPAGVSSHGLGVRQAIELARIAGGKRVSPEIRILGISTAGERGPGAGLSPAVARAVESAAWLLREQASEPSRPSRGGPAAIRLRKRSIRSRMAAGLPAPD